MLCEAAICYTGDILDPSADKYDLNYYVELAKELEKLGAHILAIKDMAGLLQARTPPRMLVSGAARGGRHADPLPHARHRRASGVASLLAAAEAGVDIVDAAMAPMTGLTTQPSLDAARRGAARLARATPASTREPLARRRRLLGGRALEVRGLRERHARRHRRGLRARDARRPVHEPAPAGRGARPRGALARGRRAYADVNQMFGDIVKVTPDLEGGRRHGPVHGHQQPHARGGARPGPRDRVPRVGGRVLRGRARPAARRLPGGRCSARCSRAPSPLRVRPGRGAAAGRLRRRRGPRSRRRCAARSATGSWRAT